MSEISKVLDTTKAEIKKVQKQQEVIASLGTELHRQKEAETNEKLMKMQSMGAEKFLQSEGVKEPADKLDKIIADVEALKKQSKKSKEETPKDTGTQVMIVKKDKIDQINNNEGIMKLFNMMQDIRKLPPREPTVRDPISGRPVEEPKSFKAPITAAVEAVLKPTEEILKAINKPVVVDEVKKCPIALGQEKEKSQSPKQGKKGNQNQNNCKKDSGKKSPEQEKKLPEPFVVKEEIKEVVPAPVTPNVVKEEKKVEPTVTAPILIKEDKKVEKREAPQSSPKNNRASQKTNGKKSPVIEKKSGPSPNDVLIDNNAKPSLAEILKVKSEEPIVEAPVEIKKIENIITEKKIEIPAFDSFDDDEEMDMEPFFDEVPKFPINNGPDAKADATPVIAKVEVVAVSKPKVEEIKKPEVASPKKEEPVAPKTDILAPIPTLPIESSVESKNVESGDSASTAKNDAKSLKNDKNAKQKTPPKNQPKAPAKNNLTVTKNDAQRQRSKSPKDKIVEKKTAAPVQPAEVKPKAPSPKASPEKEIKPVTKPTATSPRVAAKSPTKKPELPPKPEFLKNGNTQKSPSPPLAAKTQPIEIKPVASQPQPAKQSPVTKPAAPQPQATKKPNVPPRPANLKSTPAKKPNTNAKGPKVSTPATVNRNLTVIDFDL